MNDNLTLELGVVLNIDMPKDGSTGGIYFKDGQLLQTIIPVRDYSGKTIAYQFRDELFTDLKDILQYIQEYGNVRIHFKNSCG